MSWCRGVPDCLTMSSFSQPRAPVVLLPHETTRCRAQPCVFFVGALRDLLHLQACRDFGAAQLAFGQLHQGADGVQSDPRRTPTKCRQVWAHGQAGHGGPESWRPGRWDREEVGMVTSVGLCRPAVLPLTSCWTPCCLKPAEPGHPCPASEAGSGHGLLLISARLAGVLNERIC